MTRCHWCRGAIIPEYDKETGKYMQDHCLMCGRSTNSEYEFNVLVIQALTPPNDKEYAAARSEYRGKQRRRARGHTFKDD